MYALIKDGAVAEYPIVDIRAIFPTVSFPVVITPDVALPDGYVMVAETAVPTYTYEYNLTEGTPLLVEGVWTRNWIVSPASPEEVAERIDAQWGVVRSMRNARLTLCDWTQLPDAPVVHADWAAYRQALRDITTQPDPFNIVWPQEP